MRVVAHIGRMTVADFFSKPGATYLGGCGNFFPKFQSRGDVSCIISREVLLMYSDDLKFKYKHLDSACLEHYGLLSRAKASGFVCPYCDNGLGEDGTGVDFQLVNDGYKGYCHKCGQMFDVFDLIANRFKLDSKAQFGETMRRAKEIFGDEPQVEREKPPEKVPKNFERLIKYSWSRLEEFFRKRRFWRGLSLETLKKFHCGYVPNWLCDNTERIIIPDSFTHYLARYPYETKEKSVKTKPHRGTKEIFGLKNALNNIASKTDLLIFAVEGEIDAMSIDQCGFTAIAFGGSTISAYQASLLGKFPEATRFILMFDNDETGRLKAPKAAETLSECGFRVVTKFLDKKYDDFNAFLQVTPNGLKIELQTIYDSSVEEFKKLPAKVERVSPAKQKVDVMGGLPENIEGDTTQKAIPNCPVNLTIPKGFKFCSKGIYHISEKGNESIVSYTPVVPSRIFGRVDGADEHVELAIYDKFTNSWKFQKVKQTVLAKAQEIISLAEYGIHVNSDTAKKLSVFLTNIQRIGLNPVNIPRVKVYRQPGWMGDDCETFVYPPGNGDYEVQDSGFCYAEKFRTKGETKDWLRLFAEVYKSSVGARYTIGLVCAAPLTKICRARNFQGILVAPSGSGKSAIVATAMSIFGDPYKLYENCGGTGNFINEYSSKLNDLPVWLDEFQLADQRLRENFEQAIFSHAEGKTRGRMSRNAEMKEQFQFRGTRIFTSEQNVLGETFTQGAFNRTIELQAADMISEELALEVHQNINRSFGHYGQKFINYVSYHQNSVRKTYAELQERIKDYCKPRKLIESHVQHLALVYTGITYLVKFLEDAGDIKINTSLCEVSDALFSPIIYLENFDLPFWLELLPAPEESNNNVRFLSTVSELRFSHTKHFDEQAKDSTGKEYCSSAVLEPVLGIKFLNGDVAFYPSALKKVLKDDNVPVVSRIHDLAEKGLLKIKPNRSHKNQYPVTFNGESRWMYYFPKKTFLEKSPHVDK